MDPCYYTWRSARMYRFHRETTEESVSTLEDHVTQDPAAASEKNHLGDGAPPENGTGSISQHASLWRRVLGLENLEIKDQSRIFRLCISPLLLLRHPAAVWGSLMWAVTFTWVIIQGAVATQIFGYCTHRTISQQQLLETWSV